MGKSCIRISVYSCIRLIGGYCYNNNSQFQVPSSKFQVPNFQSPISQTILAAACRARTKRGVSKSEEALNEIHLIKEMIEQTKRSTATYGNYFIGLGVLVVLAALVNY